jgi:hypothetical protein
MAFDITGQVIAREAGSKDGRRLIMVCGILALPDDAPIQGEHQYTIGGSSEDNRLDLHLFTESGKDLTEDIKGQLPSQWLTSPIWRI